MDSAGQLSTPHGGWAGLSVYCMAKGKDWYSWRETGVRDELSNFFLHIFWIREVALIESESMEGQMEARS